MNIQEAALRSGLSAKTIRYYEEIGLIPSASRRANGYRSYGETDVSMLALLKHARELGFSLQERRDLIAFYRDPRRASHAVKELALAKIAEIEARIEAYKTVISELTRLAAACRGDDNPDCAILDELTAER